LIVLDTGVKQSARNHGKTLLSVKQMTSKQHLFLSAYIANGSNATQAAITAGYSEKTAYSAGQRLLKKVEVAKALSERVEKAAMGADEVLRRLSEHARASLADVLDDRERFDLKAAKKAGTDHLLKKLKVNVNKDGSVTHEYEIHDPQAALVHLGRYHKLFTDKAEVTGKDGGPIQQSFIVEVVK
jgi:phage terminase small subunit